MQEAKRIYCAFYRKLLDSQAGFGLKENKKHLSKNLDWNGPHPMQRTHGRDDFYSSVWQPLAQSFSGLTRNDDILMGGTYRDATWIASTGHYSGEFVHDWLGVPATNRPVNLRFGEFARIAEGRIQEFRTLFDIVALCRDAGVSLLPPDAGSDAFVPGPATRDGVMLQPANPATGAASLRLVEDMINGLLDFDGTNLDSMGMERFWSDDMRWYGPAGIGTTRGLEGFQAQHQGPFLKAFPDRTAAPHTALFAEGNYVCVTGWPSVIGTHLGPYLGLPASGAKARMRVMDFWRRKNGKLAENWVLIDMLDLFLQLGVDLLDKALSTGNK